MIGGVAFNPLVPNELIASAGTGVWNDDRADKSYSEHADHLE